jgi:PIN domain nuclease of toxin-antitoxin system
LTDGRTGAVLDASALLAYLQDEPGSDVVDAVLAEGAVINAVNYAEVLSRLSDRGDEPTTTHRRLERQGLTGGLLEVIPLLGEDAVTIARLRPVTRAQGLSLGDRACLATALRLERPVLTADRGWATIDVGVTVRLIRP